MVPDCNTGREGGGSKLKEISGHSTVQVTERNAHLKTDLFSPADLAAMSVDLTPGDAKTGTIGYAVATGEVDECTVKS